ncbi:Glycosyltransferase involved in cell wall bisynthesis [Paucidesulfovibrio gracilis DSM 16080]|uniref:Glycosyltransferase involved in cell wall bisynthesis n=1 Tax=Paucidesulfovibrio gracilis DSM 16080 TaxID=1121449 RepID=A0A1T4XEZ9_9BACT|nr:glycosyltransferase [Paucidesulfovibrio gracilis]SKA87635.1 Glycosyltransferase involved in cell wall bisynthesis [Paucidesulfovibrio gracilis DSM 16080]
MRIRVLHLVNGEHYAGAERVQDHLAMALPEFGYEVHFACVKPVLFRERCFCPKELVHEVPMGSRFDLRGSRRVAELARRLDARLLHTHTPRSAMLGAATAVRTGLPRVHHIHSPTSRDTQTPLRNWINAVAERISVSGTRRFIAVSESLGHWAASWGIPQRRIVVVPNGVPRHPRPGAVRDADDPVLGVVALFRPRKGLECLLDALALVRESGVRATLRAVGRFETPEYESMIRERCVRLGLEDAVEWRGFQSDVPSELTHMDIFTLPSLYGEGMPMVLLEAMAAGLPGVVSDVEGVPEAARHEREALLVPPGNAQALARELVRLARDRDLRERMGRAALERHAEHFSERVMARRVAEVYDHVLQA